MECITKLLKAGSLNNYQPIRENIVVQNAEW